MSFLLPHDVQVYLYLAPCDMRKSINTLAILVSDTLKQNPASGHLFLCIGSVGAKLPTAHRTVRTGPYTAHQVRCTHRDTGNQCCNLLLE